MKRCLSPESKKSSGSKKKLHLPETVDRIGTENDKNNKFLQDVFCHICPINFGSGRLKIFKQNLLRFGATVCDTLNDSSLTHVLVEEDADALKVGNVLRTANCVDVNVVSCLWLSHCIKAKTKLETKKYAIDIPSFAKNEHEVLEDTHTKERDKDQAENHGRSRNERMKDKFVCSKASSSQKENLNERITVELERLAAAYKSKKDTWRALGYQKAVAAIKNYPKEISTWEEAKKINGVGESLAEKIHEILESGRLRKVKEICEGQEAQCLNLFMGVWGTGPSTAQMWYTQGLRTLEDVKEKAHLTKHQQIGLELYCDLNERIPREEASQIEDYVKSAACSLKRGMIVEVCGSYRRGAKTCGDVDVLLTHEDGVSHEGLFRPLLQLMHGQGFLTHDLVIQDSNGNQQKYLGVCRLPGENQKHRRLDIIVVPFSEFAPARMYFTGSAHFNRSMRLLATKMGMSLSEHGLRTGVVRGKEREKLSCGSLLPTPTEESIFEHLGLKYRPPHERNH